MYIKWYLWPTQCLIIININNIVIKIAIHRMDYSHHQIQSAVTYDNMFVIIIVIIIHFLMTVVESLRKHAYSNILKILPPKKVNFQINFFIFFHISAQNIDCGYSLEPPRRGVLTSTNSLCFRAEISKITYTPVNPSFTIQKWGWRGSTLNRRVFVMDIPRHKEKEKVKWIATEKHKEKVKWTATELHKEKVK